MQKITISLKPKPTIHLISGLGADRFSFSRLTLNDEFNKNYVEWIKPVKDETIQDYSLRLIRNYQIKEGDIIIGLSFGGIIAIEMNKLITPGLTILISSVLSSREFPLGFKIVRKFKLNRYLTKEKISRPNPVNYYVFGAKSKEQRLRLDNIALHADPDLCSGQLKGCSDGKIIRCPLT